MTAPMSHMLAPLNSASQQSARQSTCQRVNRCKGVYRAYRQVQKSVEVSSWSAATCRTARASIHLCCFRQLPGFVIHLDRAPAVPDMHMKFAAAGYQSIRCCNIQLHVAVLEARAAARQLLLLRRWRRRSRSSCRMNSKR